MDKNKIIALVTVIVLVIVGFFIFYNKNKNNIDAAKQDKTIDLKLNNQKMNKRGVEIEILKEGAGVIAKKGDIVSVHYVGTLEDGKKFDSSVDRGIPLPFFLLMT